MSFSRGVTESSSSARARVSLKQTGVDASAATLKRARLFADLSAARRADSHNKRRRGHEESGAADGQGGGEEKKTDAEIDAIIKSFCDGYATTASLTPTPIPNPAVPLAQRAASLQALRRLLSNDDAPLTAVVSAGVVPLLLTELSGSSSSDGTSSTLLDALWCLTNIASGTTAHTRAVLPAAPTIIALLSSASSKVQEQCVWCLGNLASEEQSSRRQLIDNGVLVPLVRIMQQAVPAQTPPPPAPVPAPTDAAQLSLLRVVAWTLSNLVKSSRSSSRGGAAASPNEDAAKHAAAFASVAGTLLPAVLTLMRSSDDQLSTEVVWLVSAWANHSDAVLQHLCAGGLIESLVSRIAILQASPVAQGAGVVVDPVTQVERDPLAPALIPIVRVIGNLAHAQDSLVQALISVTFTTSPAGGPPGPNAFHLVFSTLDRALSSIHRGLKKEVCWSISNLAATNLAAVHEALILSPQGPSIFLRHLYTMLARGNFDLQREAAHALYNLARTADGRLMHLVLPRHEPTGPGGETTLQVLRAAFEFLRSRDNEATLVSLRLVELVLRLHPDGLRLVEENGGIDALETVQTQMENAELVDYAHKIVDQFFGVDQEENEVEEDAQAQPQEEYPAWRVQQTPPKPAAAASSQPPQGGFQF